MTAVTKASIGVASALAAGLSFSSAAQADTTRWVSLKQVMAELGPVKAKLTAQGKAPLGTKIECRANGGNVEVRFHYKVVDGTVRNAYAYGPVGNKYDESVGKYIGKGFEVAGTCQAGKIKIAILNL